MQAIVRPLFFFLHRYKYTFYVLHNYNSATVELVANRLYILTARRVFLKTKDFH